MTHFPGVSTTPRPVAAPVFSRLGLGNGRRGLIFSASMKIARALR